MTTDEDSYIMALIDLHAGLDRQGPGDAEFAADILDRLPELPDGPVADLGCGTGAASVILAHALGRPVTCVDAAEPFLAELTARADAAGATELVTPLAADMGALDANNHQFALIWSEGAAYTLTFAGALAAWRPLLRPGGVAVISELSWFTANRPDAVAAFWDAAYPTMGTEPENLTRATGRGFEVLFTERLPSSAWWTSYYTPLAERLDAASGGSAAMQQVIADTRAEIDLFREHSDAYGYTYYVLRTV